MRSLLPCPKTLRALLALFLFLLIAASARAEWRKCLYVIDGDTIIVSGQEKVRLIGVDAPEIPHEDKPGEPGGEKARKFLKKLVEGKKVNLEYDWERLDKHGRTLAYVYTEEGKLANEELILSGNAEAMRHFTYSKKERFLEAEKKARQHRERKPAKP